MCKGTRIISEEAKGFAKEKRLKNVGLCWRWSVIPTVSLPGSVVFLSWDGEFSGGFTLNS